MSKHFYGLEITKLSKWQLLKILEFLRKGEFVAELTMFRISKDGKTIGLADLEWSDE